MTTLSKNSVAWAIKHLVDHLDTDIFPSAFEFPAIQHSKDDVIEFLAKQDICQWSTRPARKCLAPKQRYGFRQATQLDPLDMVFYLSLCLEVGEHIERFRVPTHRNVAFSARFKRDNNDHHFFDHEIGYSEFQEYSHEHAKKHKYVIITDIADFYPRIYHHRLENALNSAIRPFLPSHATAIVRLLRGWSQNVSYGIPVGNNPSRLLAELVIDDVDRNLLAESFVFTRFVDDYRIFCESRPEAYRQLARLANVLYDTHGLTLQSQKTHIIPSDIFINQFIYTDERKAIEALAERFRYILRQLGLSNPYELIDYDDLPADIQSQIDALNLEGMLQDQLDAEEIDIPMTRFLINRLGYSRRTEVVWALLNNVEKLYPVFLEVVRYIVNVGDHFHEEARNQIGEALLRTLHGSVVSQLEYHRMLILSPFAASGKWGNRDSIAPLLNQFPDNLTSRSVLLALGKASQDYLLRPRKTNIDQMSPWVRRAFIYAASCLPKDERKHWYRAIERSCDYLENVVVKWAKAQPIND